MTNPFLHFTRRNFLRSILASAFAMTPLNRARAATPVTAKLLGAPTATSFTINVSATSAAPLIPQERLRRQPPWHPGWGFHVRTRAASGLFGLRPQRS